MVALQLLSILCLSKVLKTTVELKDQSLNTPNIALCPWHCAYLLIGTFYPDFVLHWPTSINSATRGDFVVPHARTAIKQLFRLWVPLLGIVSHLKPALFHGICPARFTSPLKLLFSPGPGLGAPLSSYLEVALYKFHRKTDKQTN